VSAPTPVLDIGGTHVAGALIAEGVIVRKHVRPLDAAGSSAAVVAELRACALELGAETGSSWSVALPGPFDYAHGRGTFDGVGKFAGLAGVELRAPLAAALATEPGRIRFVNDADAYALGEWAAAGRAGRLCCVTLGTGVGSGFVEGGRVLDDDPRIPPAGEAHRLTWRGEPLEDRVSRRAIIRAYGDPASDVREIAERARAGDGAAQRVLAEAMAVLGEVLAPWVRSFAPDRLVVGGAIARSWDLIGPPLARALAAHAAPIPPAPALLQDDAPLIGAAISGPA
jgi:glucokinase